MRYLLDTCVISEWAKKSPNAAVLHWLEAQEDDALFISAVTVGEMRKGIERLPLTDSRRPRLESWCNSVVRSFEDHVIPFDKEIAHEWGRIVGAGMRTGKQKPEVDMQIVATAFKLGMTLVTRNVKDMAGAGVPIVNPFEYSADKGDSTALGRSPDRVNATAGRLNATDRPDLHLLRPKGAL